MLAGALLGRRTSRATAAAARTFAVALLAAVPAPARADPPPVATPPRVTVHVFDEKLSVDVASSVLGGFAVALGEDARLRYVDLTELLDPATRAAAELDLADQQLGAAQQAFDEMDLDAARTRLENAIRRYERYLPHQVARDGGLARVRDAWTRMAAVRFLEGSSDAARDALRHVFALDAKAQLAPAQLPPQMKRLVRDERALFDALGTGRITVETTPPGATLYVGGVSRGTTPTTVDDVPAGPQYVTVERRGYQPATTTVTVGGGGEEVKSEQILLRYPGDPLEALLAARQELGQPAAPPAVREAARHLGVDLLALVRVRKGPPVRVTAWLYDARSAQLVRQVERVATDDDLLTLARAAGTELLAGARLDGARVEPAREPPRRPGPFAGLGSAIATRASALRRSRWFWPVVGGVAGVVVAGAAVGVGVGLAERQRGFSPTETVLLLGTSK